MMAMGFGGEGVKWLRDTRAAGRPVLTHFLFFLLLFFSLR